MASAKFVAEGLRGDILAGRLRPGSELQQASIAERFKVSRIPVRDALALLANEKLVKVSPNRGAHVIQLSKEELCEVYELRQLLECNCIIAASDKASAEQNDRIDYMYHRSSLEAGRDGWSDGDWAFHEALYVPSGKLRHIELIKELRRTCQVHVAPYQTLVGSTDRWLEDHMQLVELYKARRLDDLSALLKKHLSGAMDVLLGQMD
ncbi:MAG: GntR family transcriptional regulator [Kordiimonas sp.]